MTVPESAEPSYSLTPDPGEVELPTTDPATHEHSDLREYVVLLRRHALLILFVTVVTAGVTFFLSVRMPKQYTAGTTLLYSPTGTATGTDNDPTRAIATLVGIGSSNTVLGPIASQYKLGIQSLKKSVSVSGDTTLGPAQDLGDVRVAREVRTAREQHRPVTHLEPPHPAEGAPAGAGSRPPAAACDVRRQGRPELRRSSVCCARTARAGTGGTECLDP